MGQAALVVVRPAEMGTAAQLRTAPFLLTKYPERVVPLLPILLQQPSPR